MKLHLPKVLFAAVVAALTCVQQAGAANYSVYTSTDITDPGTSEVITPAYGYNVVQWSGGNTSNPNGLCYGDYYQATYDSQSGNMTLGDRYPSATATNNDYQAVLSTNTSNYNTILFDQNSPVNNDAEGLVFYDIGGVKISGLIVTSDSKVKKLWAKNGNSARSMTIGESDGTTGYTTIAKDFCLDMDSNTLSFNGTQVWNIDSGKTFTIQNASTLTNSGDITISSGAVSISGSLTNSGDITISSGAVSISGSLTNNGTLTVDGALKISSTITNGESGSIATGTDGVIVIDNYISFGDNFTTESFTVNNEASDNGYASGTITVVDGGTVGADLKVQVNGKSYTTSTGVVSFADDTTFWVNTGTVTKGGDGESDGIAQAARIAMNGGTLHIAEGTIAAGDLAVTDGEGSSISLAADATMTADATTDSAAMALVTGTGILEVTGGDWGTVIKSASDFTGTTYVKTGKFTYNAADTKIGNTLKLGADAHMQVNNTVNNTKQNEAGYDASVPDAVLEAGKEIVLEAGGHDVYVNGDVIMDIYGTVSGEGSLNKHAGGVMNLKAGSSVAKLESSTTTNTAGILNIEKGATVGSFTSAGNTTNILGGSSVGSVTMNGGTTNLGVSDGESLSLTNVTYNGGTINNRVKTTVDSLAVAATKTMAVGGSEELDVTTLELGAGAKLTAASGSITLGTLVLDLAAYSDSYATTHTLVSAGTLTVSGSLTDYQNVSVADGAYLASVNQVENSLVLTYEATKLTTTVSGVQGLFDAENNMLTLTVADDISSACKNIVVTGFGENVLNDILGLDGITGGSIVGITLTDGENNLVGNGTNISFQGADGFYKGEFVDGEFQGYAVAYIPEPATATLSLLALAGLAARRR